MVCSGAHNAVEKLILRLTYYLRRSHGASLVAQTYQVVYKRMGGRRMASPLAKVESDLMRGAGPTAVLQLLARQEMYGYELVSKLRDETSGTLAMGHSTLYPLLYNLEAKGLIASKERVAESGRARRYYSLTAAGRKALKLQREQWQSLTGAMVKLGIVAPVAG